MILLVDDLVAIGLICGVESARRVYYALAREPIDRYGNRVDWLEIQGQIHSRKGQ